MGALINEKCLGSIIKKTCSYIKDFMISLSRTIAVLPHKELGHDQMKNLQQ